MRKFIGLLLVIIMISMVFSACGRYENGPSCSFRSVKSRAVGEWHITDLLVNDIHEEDLFEKESSTIIVLNDDGTYEYSVISLTKSHGPSSGLWSFGDDKTMLIFTEIDTVNGPTERSYQITRLSNAEMWLVGESVEYVGKTGLVERRFEKKQD